MEIFFFIHFIVPLQIDQDSNQAADVKIAPACACTSCNCQSQPPFIPKRNVLRWPDCISSQSGNLKLRSSRSDSNRRLRATVGQNSSSFQMASACHVCAAVLVHVARRRRLDSDLDERSLSTRDNCLMIDEQFS